MALSDTTSRGAQTYPVETVEELVEIKASADEVFKVLSNQNHLIPEAASDHIQEIAVHEGDWETSGSVKVWNYTVDGRVETFKERVEIDEANKSVTLTALDGHVLEQYRSFKVTFQVIPGQEGEGGFVKITQEYGKKLNENDAPCYNYIGVAVNMTRDIDAHLLKK